MATDDALEVDPILVNTPTAAGGETQLARVLFRWGEEKSAATVGEALQTAYTIIQAAQDAEHDELLRRFYLEQMHQAPGLADVILAWFREYREHVRGRGDDPAPRYRVDKQPGGNGDGK